MDSAIGKTNRNMITSLFALFCLLLPFEEVLAGSFGSVLKLIGIAIIVLAVCSIRGFYFSNIWLLPAFWIIYCIISGAWANSFYWWQYFLRIYISQFAFAFVLGQLPPDIIDLHTVKKGLAIGATIAACLIIFMPTTSTYIEGRRTIILWGANMDPNILSAVFIMGFYSLLDIQMHGRSELKIYRLLSYVSEIAVVIGIIYTGSRGGLISLLGSLGVLLFCLLRKGIENEQRKRIYQLLVILCILVILLLLFIPEEYLSSRFSWSNLFGLNDYQNGAHNRYTIWMRAWTLFKKNPLFGYGCGNFYDAIATVYIECASHNLVVLLLVEYGIIGSFPFFLFLFLTLKRLYQAANPVMLAMFIAILIISLSLDSLPYKYFWVTLTFSYLDMQCKYNIDNEVSYGKRHYSSIQCRKHNPALH